MTSTATGVTIEKVDSENEPVSTRSKNDPQLVLREMDFGDSSTETHPSTPPGRPVPIYSSTGYASMPDEEEDAPISPTHVLRVLRDMTQSMRSLENEISIIRDAVFSPDKEPTHKRRRSMLHPHDENEEILDASGHIRSDKIGLSLNHGNLFLNGIQVTWPEEIGQSNFFRSSPGAPRPSSPDLSLPIPLPTTHTPPVRSSPGTSGLPSSARSPNSPMTPVQSNTPTVSPVTSPDISPPGVPSTQPSRISPSYDRPGFGAAKIQRFDNKSLDWPAWLGHFSAIAELHGWQGRQKAISLVSYLDAHPMEVAQELSHTDMYDFDILTATLGKRFDPAIRVSANRTRFHARGRRHGEDIETFADALVLLCCRGYPDSLPKCREEMVCEQFIRGQPDTLVQGFLWTSMRTTQIHNIQTLIEVCQDVEGMAPGKNSYRPAGNVFAMNGQGQGEPKYPPSPPPPAMGWNQQRNEQPLMSTEQLTQMAQRCGFVLRPAARRAQDQTPTGTPPSPGVQRSPRRDYSNIKCFSCGKFGHTRVRCPNPDPTLPFKPKNFVFYVSDDTETESLSPVSGE